MTDSASTTTPTADSTDHLFPVDVEHSGIRLALPVLTVLGFVLVYLVSISLVNTYYSDNILGCLPFPVALLGAIAVAAISNVILKRIWPSGRTLLVDSTGIQLNDVRRGRDNHIRVEWAKRINWLAWRFKVNRGSARVPKGWLVLSVDLLQDDSDIVFYTFMPEKSAKPLYELFTPLLSRTQLESEKMPIKERTEQRRLLTAEEARWKDGAELRQEDFTQIMALMSGHLQEWQEVSELKAEEK